MTRRHSPLRPRAAFLLARSLPGKLLPQHSDQQTIASPTHRQGDPRRGAALLPPAHAPAASFHCLTANQGFLRGHASQSEQPTCSEQIVPHSAWVQLVVGNRGAWSARTGSVCCLPIGCQPGKPSRRSRRGPRSGESGESGESGVLGSCPTASGMDGKSPEPWREW